MSRDDILNETKKIVKTGTVEQPGRQIEEAETESPGTVYWTRRNIARLVVLLAVAIPVAYSIVMGIVSIVRHILEDAW